MTQPRAEDKRVGEPYQDAEGLSTDEKSKPFNHRGTQRYFGEITSLTTKDTKLPKEHWSQFISENTFRVSC
jgi:hypothetical protein